MDVTIFSGTATFRDLARIAGFLNSLYLAVGSISRSFTRQIHSTLQSRSYWDCKFVLSLSLAEELRFWYLNIDAYNGFGVQLKFIPGAVIYCDASDYAFGGYCLELNKSQCEVFTQTSRPGQKAYYWSKPSVFFGCPKFPEYDSVENRFQSTKF